MDEGGRHQVPYAVVKSQSSSSTALPSSALARRHAQHVGDASDLLVGAQRALTGQHGDTANPHCSEIKMIFVRSPPCRNSSWRMQKIGKTDGWRAPHRVKACIGPSSSRREK